MKRILSLVVGILFCGILISYGVTQEAPVGRVSGKVTMKENGQPIVDADITLEPTWNTEDAPKARGVETADDGAFTFRNVPTGSYFVRLSSKSHHIKDTTIYVEEAKDTVSNLVGEPDEPYLHLYCSQKVFTSDEKPKIELHGFTPNSKEVKVSLYRLSLNAIEKAGGLSEALSPLSEEDPGDLKKLESSCEHLRDLEHPLQKLDAEGSFIDSIAVGDLSTGIYFIECATDKLHTGTAIYVSDLALVTKASSKKLLCYTSHLKTGQPVGGAEVSLIRRGKMVSVGKTNAQGLLDVAMPNAKDYRALVVAQTKDSVAFIGYRDNRESDDQTKIVGYCERPAYRPGDEVNFKGIVRQKAQDGYTLPKPGPVTVTIKDPDDNVLETQHLSMNAHGAFYGKFTTSKESKPGSYAVECQAQGHKGGIYANVVAYRKPEYSIEVTPDKPIYTIGDTATATVECKYYYGGPVVGAKVEADVYRSPKWSYDSDDEDDDDGYRYSYYSNAGEYSQSVKVVTDAAGRAKIEFPTRAEDDPDSFANDYTYNIHVSVTEDDAKYFDGEGEVMVVRGDHAVRLQVANPLVGVGDTVDLVVKTTDPTQSKVPFPNQPVTIEIGHETWTRRETVFIPEQTLKTTTGADGIAHVPIPVTKARSMTFRATSIDRKGNRIVDESWVYVEGSPAMLEREKGRIEVTLDRQKYHSGDTVKALLRTDMPGGSALVTVESDGIVSRQVVPLTSESTMVRIPVQKEFAPNVFVAVAYVKDKKFLEAERKIKVNRNDRNLNVQVICDKKLYKPGETALLHLKTTDSEGKPMAADVSVGVVDEGIYDIAEDETDLMADFYPNRSNEVETNFSFPEIYLDGGDKGTSKVPIRKTFRDTAQWNPSVWTGDKGEALVRVKLPDNLTQWRVTAVGVSDRTTVGMTTEKFRARKDLMVRLQLPQYLVSGDRQRMSIVVANDTGKDQDVHVQADVAGLSASEMPSRIIQVPDGKPQTIDFDVTASEAEQGTITARVWIDGGPSDGVQQSVPIKPHGRPVTASQAGEGTTTFSLPIRPTADPKYGGLTLSLSPTLAGDLLKSLDDLIGYPYGCVEQTMSRFMPSILVDKTVRELGLPRPKKLEELPKIVRDSLTRLEAMRHEDGGFGWWVDDTSTPFMTALVLDGLDRAKSAGQDVSRLNVKPTLDWAEKWLSAPRTDNTVLDRDVYYLIYALERWGRRDAAKYLNGVKIKKMNPVELATIALAYHEAGEALKANAVLGRLASLAQGTDLAYWQNSDGAWGEETTAIALVAFTTIRPNDSIVPRIVSYLRKTKQGDMWDSTRDTSYVLVGLTQYLATTKELATESNVEVIVDGKTVRTLHLDPRKTDDPDWTIRIPRQDLGQGSARIQIRTSGEGRCYYSALLKTLDIAPNLAAESTDSDLLVDRKYFRLEPRRLNNGTMKLLPSEKPVDRFQSGDLIRVELTINAKQLRRFVMIDEPVPSSCHIQEREDLGPNEEWSYWWCSTVIRDDRIAFFSTYMEPGEHKIVYTLRAEQSGFASALPTTVGNMYDPARSSSTSENQIEVTRS